jgi:cell division protein FtsQ
MTARVRRGASARSRTRKPSARVTVPRKIAKKLPVNEARANRLATVAFTGFVALIIVAVVIALDLPAKAMTQAGEALGRAGFAVKRVDVTGLKRMDAAPVYAIAAGQQSMAMPLVDVEAIRAQLLRYGWIKDARVSRRLPDTLVIDIVERKPAALWQSEQQLALIDAEGVVLDRVPVNRMPDLPLLIGPGANDRARELSGLLDAVPALKPQLASATWVGRRRWDLSFQTGEIVALPEGASAARQALEKFAEMDRSTGLLGRGLVRFDLRVPGKMIVRLPRAPGEPILPSPPPVES